MVAPGTEAFCSSVALTKMLPVCTCAAAMAGRKAMVSTSRIPTRLSLRSMRLPPDSGRSQFRKGTTSLDLDTFDIRAWSQLEKRTAERQYGRGRDGEASVLG